MLGPRAQVYPTHARVLHPLLMQHWRRCTPAHTDSSIRGSLCAGGLFADDIRYASEAAPSVKRALPVVDVADAHWQPALPFLPRKESTRSCDPPSDEWYSETTDAGNDRNARWPCAASAAGALPPSMGNDGLRRYVLERPPPCTEWRIRVSARAA